MNKNFPRLIISATQSGSGKTTITTGLLGGRFKSGGIVDALNVSTTVTSSPRTKIFSETNST